MQSYDLFVHPPPNTPPFRIFTAIMDEQYIFLSWDDSKTLHPASLPGDFIVEFSQTLFLEGGWRCGLVDVKYTTSFESAADVGSLYICCDICEEAPIRGTRLPVLRRVQLTGAEPAVVAERYDNIYYTKTTRQLVDKIRIFVLDKSLNTVTFVNGQLDCTLHIKRER